jgi:hypothetical protein
VEKSDVVINLLGKQMKTRKFDYVGSNVEAVTNIAKVKKEKKEIKKYSDPHIRLLSF